MGSEIMQDYLKIELVKGGRFLFASALHYYINEKTPRIVQDYWTIARLDIEENHMLPQHVGF